MQSFKAQVYDVGLAVTPKLLKVGAKVFTTLDVRKLYQQVLLDEPSKNLAVVNMSSKELLQYHRLTS